MTLTTHGACGKAWTQRGERTSHCDGCHQTFHGLALFDQHRVGPWEARRCLDPAIDRLGTEKHPATVTQDDEGVWCTPEGIANREAVGRRLTEGRARPNLIPGYTEGRDHSSVVARPTAQRMTLTPGIYKRGPRFPATDQWIADNTTGETP